MAEKRVSVRLAAVGGRQVRAELEGIGEAGARGFGRLSSEMELANTRLSGFARKAGVALAAVTAAAAAAGVAMVRSGLETIGAQADMAASLKTTVESLQVLTWAGELAGVSMGEIEQATKKLTTRLSEAAAGSGTAVGALARLHLTAAALQALPLDQRIIAIQDALNRFVPEAERAAVASDLFGDRAAIAFLRVDSATLRDAAKDVRDFRVAVSAADAAQIERTGDALDRLSLIWLGLTNRLTAAVAPALETVAKALADAARASGPLGRAIDLVFDNLGRLATYAAIFAAFMGARWVAGLAAAALSVRGLATALVVLRGALIRTGIGALIVGVGELVYGIRRADDLAVVVAFFEARNGRLYGFRFKDWADFKSCLPSQIPGPTDQAIGTGDGSTTTFPLTKRYSSGAQSWTRAITKPVAGTVTIALNGVPQPSGWSVSPATGFVTRAGAPWIDVMRPSGRDFPLQPHFGVNRIANWSPSVSTTVTTEGLPITSVGTVSHPTLASTNLAASMRRWRLTSAAVVDSVADQRSAGWACWRGNAAGLGGWTFVTRISLTTLQATGMGFFGLYGSTAALATTLTLAAAINCIGIGFQRGTHTRWQLVANDGTGAPTLADMGASFAIATGGVLTIFIAAPPNGSSVWVRVVDEVSSAVFEQEITADLPSATQFLSPRLFLNTGATAAAVAYDCAGVYLETDF